MTTMSSKSSLSTIGPHADDIHEVNRPIESKARRRNDRPPLTPTLRALRRALTTGSGPPWETHPPA